MDYSFYTIMVTLASIIYSFVIREVQNRLGNQEEMKRFQEETKKLNDELKEASKRNDKSKMDEINKKQMEMFPKMSKMLFGQFKTVGVVLIVFFAFSWAVGFFDPTVKDDVTLELKDDGNNCDLAANDKIYGVCFTPTENEGPWITHLKIYNGGDLIIENYDKFLVGKGNLEEAFIKQGKGDPVEIEFNKKQINLNEQIEMRIQPSKGHKFEITLNSGTWFYVDLPFTIPILEIKRINESYWWFIFVAIISGLVISFIMGKLKKNEVRVEQK
ncbi:DUF106 domain-containing protein [Candidatus Micrarchaeota archaeon]|nr:DUF106 domain-containing protein [Candidatus Micrarchaeota archaeon]